MSNPSNNPLQTFSASASFTPTAAAYGAGDLMDVAKPFALVGPDGNPITAGAPVRIQTSVLRIDQTGLQASEAAYTLHLYSRTPPSAQADNAAWTLASGDLPYYLGSLAIGTPVDLGAACFVRTGGLDTDIKTVASTVWGVLVTVAGFTATAVARQVDLMGRA